jgi:threonine dehydrogenase-like Zn-dependent dehydrogenase
MQQLFFLKKGTLEWWEMPTPKIEKDIEALVRPFAVAKCDIDDIFLFSNLPFKLAIGSKLGLVDPSYYKTFGKNFFKGPFPFGHECVAEVMEIGANVTSVKVGDVVSVPFQISCGSCLSCVGGFTHACEKAPAMAMYGFGKHLQFGGAMCDLIKIPYADGMLLKIPAGINPIHLASLSDNVPDAYRTVGPYLEKDSQKSVLILGGKAKSISLYSVLIAKALGSPRVHFVSRDNDHLTAAMRCGADKVLDRLDGINEKYDITVDCSVSEKGMKAAIQALAKGGVCTNVGMFIRKTNAPFIDMYVNGVTFVTGFSNARTDAEKVLNLINSKKLNLETVTTRLDTWENAKEAILSKSAKVIVARKRLL